MSAKTKKGPCGTLLFLAEGEGFEPSIRFRIHTFQACAFDHSATSPEGANHTTTHPIGQPETVKKWRLAPRYWRPQSCAQATGTMTISTGLIEGELS